MLEVWNEMQQGTNTPAHALADAAAANDVSEIEELLASGQVSVDSLDRDSRTALMHATGILCFTTLGLNSVLLVCLPLLLPVSAKCLRYSVFILCTS